jgi:hypothetical protein
VPRSGFRVSRVVVLAVLLPSLLPVASLVAQDSAEVRLEIKLDSVRGGTRNPIVFTRNLLEDTPWLATLRQGLPVRLQYRLEIWRARSGWLDVLERQLEWTILVRHEPVLDQFSVLSVIPGRPVQRRLLGTSGALQDMLSVGSNFTVGPRTEGHYYYAAYLDVTTLSDSDLDAFERALRGELDARGGASLGDRVRRLILRLGGLPATHVKAQSEAFDVKR